jgi:hypothetical protein
MPMQGGLFGALKASAVKDEFLDALEQLTAQGQTVINAPNSPRYAPKVMRSVLKGRTVRELHDAMQALLMDGRIVVASVRGPDRHRIGALIRPENGVREGAGIRCVSL